MPQAPRLAPNKIDERLADLPEWALIDGKLHREFRFPDFKHAFAFMTGLALKADQMDHHPEWSNVYNLVTIDLTTHDSSGITEKDFELATEAEKLAG
jgi:4a-hydroxytetrahydrobiopterin dehydratase